jgi:hypothetical protein
MAAVAVGAALFWVITQMIHRGAPPQAATAAVGASSRPATIGLSTDGSADGSALPAEFTILQTHNAFAPGTPQGHRPLGGPEALLIFKGVVGAGADFTAFIENQAARQVIQAVVGDAVARGRIKSIDLDAIVYEVGGNSRRIEVGQNLNGEVVAPPATQPSPSAPTPDVQSPPEPPDGAGTPNGNPSRSSKRRGGM